MIIYLFIFFFIHYFVTFFFFTDQKMLFPDNEKEHQQKTSPTVENVHVVCRLRPFSEEDKLRSIKNIAIIEGDQTITIIPKAGMYC